MIPTPFENIAISLSGGGYRASCFHLGSLSYLKEREYKNSNLLQKVSILSTISGGTITGAMYALSAAKGESFESFFGKLHGLLEKDELAELALKKLNRSKSWQNGQKTRDLINAFAEVYHEHFFEEATFEQLNNNKNSHLQDCIFGSSEFTTGNQFRLQEELGEGRFGNAFLSLPMEVAKNIRLADAVAASSCFPGGFEPMIMPRDFSSGPDSELSKSWKSKIHDELEYPTTAIMDGGIIDNQGIEGVKLAEDRYSRKNKGKAFIGTFIVSDVSEKKMKPYKVPELHLNKFKDLINLRNVNFLFAFLLISISFSFLFFSPPRWLTILLSSLLPLSLGWFALFFFLRTKFRGLMARSFGDADAMGMRKDLKVLMKTPIYVLIYLLELRATSSLKMVTDVFMRRIRQLQLSSLFDRDSDWFYRVCPNYIYTLFEKKDIALSLQINEIVHEANQMPTSLWFSQKEKENRVLDKLIACGQLSMCFNLFTYIENLKKNLKYKVWKELPEEEKVELEKLELNMKEDWERFQKNPYWLIEKLKSS